MNKRGVDLVQREIRLIVGTGCLEGWFEKDVAKMVYKQKWAKNRLYTIFLLRMLSRSLKMSVMSLSGLVRANTRCYKAFWKYSYSHGLGENLVGWGWNRPISWAGVEPWFSALISWAGVEPHFWPQISWAGVEFFLVKFSSFGGLGWKFS